MPQSYDLIIIGGGVAGMAAGVFAARNRLDTVILEKAVMGGQPAVAEKIENFPGFPDLDGWGLTTRLEKHVVSLGVRIIESEDVKEVLAEGHMKRIIGSRGTYLAKSVIVASGGQPRLLGVPGEKEFSRKGVHYCAHCAGLGYEGKRIAVVGGGESALLGVLYLAGIGNEVFLIHRRESFRGEKILQERILHSDKIRIIRDSRVEEIFGEKRIQGIRVVNLKTGDHLSLDLDAVFIYIIYIGFIPNRSFVHVDKDDKGFIQVNSDMETSQPGVFACGNVVRENAQIISSMGEGAMAALAALRYIMETVA